MYIKDNFLKQHMQTVRTAMEKLEEKLTYSDNLSIDAICAMSGELQTLHGHLMFLAQVDAAVNKSPIVKPKPNLSIK